MKRLVIALSLTVAFLVGCLTATVATQLVVPSIKAGTNPQKWSHYCANIRTMSWETMVENIDQIGKQGWELVDSEGTRFCFKRPLP